MAEKNQTASLNAHGSAGQQQPVSPTAGSIAAVSRLSTSSISETRASTPDSTFHHHSTTCCQLDDTQSIGLPCDPTQDQNDAAEDKMENEQRLGREDPHATVGQSTLRERSETWKTGQDEKTEEDSNSETVSSDKELRDRFHFSPTPQWELEWVIVSKCPWDQSGVCWSHSI